MNIKNEGDFNLVDNGSSNQCVWLFGRGASIACGLDWTEPPEWLILDRDDRTKRVCRAIRNEMQKIPIAAVGPYKDLLSFLSGQRNFKHLFLTTNWDFLLQREINFLIKKYSPGRCPAWMNNSHVCHLNGSVEEPLGENRSGILFETDSPCKREESQEVNQALNRMIWSKLFVVVGMSFRCETDRMLLSFLKKHEDNLPYGEANWIILNSDKEILKDTVVRFKDVMRRANVVPIHQKFEDWILTELAQLLKN